jgi:hypothetical protein
MTGVGPPPWPGCDMSSEEWRRYCEAFTYTRDAGRSTKAIGQYRGWGAAMILEHDIKVVRADYAGLIPDRTKLQKLMQWRPDAAAVSKRKSMEGPTKPR